MAPQHKKLLLMLCIRKRGLIKHLKKIKKIVVLGGHWANMMERLVAPARECEEKRMIRENP
jgi:hypothetical protein